MKKLLDGIIVVGMVLLALLLALLKIAYLVVMVMFLLNGEHAMVSCYKGGELLWELSTFKVGVVMFIMARIFDLVVNSCRGGKNKN
ncbi:hypothetical protein IJJ27_03410 [bacterium]|nr:hypothetical protein [bacterium]